MKIFQKCTKLSSLNVESGQVAVEYVILLSAVVVILFTVMGQVKEYMLADQGNCKPNSTSIVCQFERALSLDQFRRFRVLR